MQMRRWRLFGKTSGRVYKEPIYADSEEKAWDSVFDFKLLLSTHTCTGICAKTETESLEMEEVEIPAVSAVGNA